MAYKTFISYKSRSSGLSAPWRVPLPECFQVLVIGFAKKQYMANLEGAKAGEPYKNLYVGGFPPK